MDLESEGDELIEIGDGEGNAHQDRAVGVEGILFDIEIDQILVAVPAFVADPEATGGPSCIVEVDLGPVGSESAVGGDEDGAGALLFDQGLFLGDGNLLVAIGGVVELDRIGERFRIGGRNLGDHGDSVGFHQRDVFPGVIELEVGVKFPAGAVLSGGEDEEELATFEDGAVRDLPLGQIGGIVGEVVAADVDRIGIRIVELEPVFVRPILVFLTGLVVGDELGDEGILGGEGEVNDHPLQDGIVIGSADRGIAEDLLPVDDDDGAVAVGIEGAAVGGAVAGIPEVDIVQAGRSDIIDRVLAVHRDVPGAHAGAAAFVEEELNLVGRVGGQAVDLHRDGIGRAVPTDRAHDLSQVGGGVAVAAGERRGHRPVSDLVGGGGGDGDRAFGGGAASSLPAVGPESHTIDLLVDIPEHIDRDDGGGGVESEVVRAGEGEDFTHDDVGIRPGVARGDRQQSESEQ